MAMFEKIGAAWNAVITVDAQSDTVGFYSINGNDHDSIQYKLFNCKAKVLNDEFFTKFGEILKDFRGEFPQFPMQKVALVLPDHLFLMDTIMVPMIHRKALQHSLDLAIKTLYKNKSELEINSEILQQNRKQVTYAITGIRKDLLRRFKAICNENGVSVQGVSFAANTTVNAASVINSKVKGSTCLLLDIKEKYTRFAFMVKGKTMGYYSLPFGYTIMMKNRVAAEDMLFDHASGDLLVLNAKERARSKQLTLAEEIATFEEIEEDGLYDDEEHVESVESVESDSPVGGTRKMSRKLPKFMLRPTPQSREECVHENFRLFVKWTLELIASNPEIAANGALTTVYVNMPEEFGFLFDMVNLEADENNISFAPLLTGAGNSKKVMRLLDIYGGFYISQQNKNGIF